MINMIRKLKTEEINDVLDIWVKASIDAHSFVSPEFWESRMDVMRDTYIPASNTYVFEENEIIKGFFSLHNDTLAAMFVSPEFHGRGIGRRLMDKAKSLRNSLELTVYKENPKSIDFYRKRGFRIIQEQIDKHTGHIEILMKYGV